MENLVYYIRGKFAGRDDEEKNKPNCRANSGEEVVRKRKRVWVRRNDGEEVDRVRAPRSAHLRGTGGMAHIRVPFETPLHWIIQIGLSTDFRYMTCRVRGTHGLYAMPSSRCSATLHSPHVPTLPPVLLQVRSLILARLLLLGDQPNGISSCWRPRRAPHVPNLLSCAPVLYFVVLLCCRVRPGRAAVAWSVCVPFDAPALRRSVARIA